MRMPSRFQKFIFDTTMSLPDGLLVRMSGGNPIEVEGDVLDARLQFITHKAKSRPAIDTLPIEKGRAGFDAAMALLDVSPAENVEIGALHFGAKDGHVIAARSYRPNNQDPNQPLLVWYHGGGGVFGNLETSHSFLTHLAVNAGIAIISVDYRLAPEYPFPTGFEDSHAAYVWALGQAESLGAPKGRAAVGGDSMGGIFSAAIAQETIRLGLPKPEYQFLVYPALDFEAETPSRISHADSYPLNQTVMAWFWKLYAENADKSDARLAPGRETDLADLPPALIYTAGFDVLRDEAIDYHKRLQAQGVPSLHRHYPSLCHGFISMAGICPAAKTANTQMAKDIATTI